MAAHTVIDRVAVLMYHRVADDDDSRELAVPPATFRKQMHALAKQGIQAIGLTEFLEWSQGGRTLSWPSVLITFDDGYLDVYQQAAPVLQQLGWPATIFLISDLLGGSDRWRRGGYPLMSWPQARELAQAGFSLQSHSRSHVDLTTVDAARLQQEIAGSKQALEDGLGLAVDTIAYPYGRHNARVIDCVRQAGFRAGFSVQSGFNRPNFDAYRYRRLDVYGSDSARRLLRKVELGTNDGSWQNKARFYAGRLAAKLGVAANR